MANLLRFHRDVARDLHLACNWYDEVSIELGNRFRAAVGTALNGIERSPKAAPLVNLESAVRFRRLHRFPYLVLYRIEGDATFVMGVAHSSADLQSWIDRTIG